MPSPHPAPHCWHSLLSGPGIGASKGEVCISSYPESPGLPSGLLGGRSPAWSQSASCRWSGAHGHALGLGCPGHLPPNTPMLCRLSLGRTGCPRNPPLSSGSHSHLPSGACKSPVLALAKWHSALSQHPGSVCSVAVLTLTLGNGQDQVPFFPKASVELWRPEEAVPEGGEPRPSNGWLYSLLGRKMAGNGQRAHTCLKELTIIWGQLAPQLAPSSGQ